VQTDTSPGPLVHRNAGLIGDPQARAKLSTPTLLLDLDIFEANIAAAVDLGREANKHIRPHVKGQKCIAIADRLIAAGAMGLCCTTLTETELMQNSSAPSLLITSPVVGPAMLDRLLALARGPKEILVVVDSTAAVDTLEAKFANSDCQIGVVVDLDAGQRRTGVRNKDQLLTVAQSVDQASHLRFDGIQAYYGHLQAVADYAERKQRANAAQAEIKTCIDHLARAGLPPKIVSGGGTGTAMIDVHGPFTELQLGSFALMDSIYDAVQISEHGQNPFQPALFVLGRVISANQPDRVTTDIGMKALAPDGGPGKLVAPEGVSAEFANAGDEHGFLIGNELLDLLSPGDLVAVMPSHCDTTVNLHSAIHAMRGDLLEDLWPVEARGSW